ncbi:hypothetical protein [Nocardiopsis protaetiae]|uniref:hypothetical protein n=1 Tax=Nocardiopsis protaetiae TaxID=3382270 RepID=UPI00387B98A6
MRGPDGGPFDGPPAEAYPPGARGRRHAPRYPGDDGGPPFGGPRPGPFPGADAHAGPHGGPPGAFGEPAPPPTGARGKAIRHARPLWKRLHLPYAAVLVLLFPVMLVWPYTTEVRSGLETGAVRPQARPVGVGDTATLVGSEWRVTGYITGFLAGAEPPPEGLEILDVGFRVTPGDEKSAELLRLSCEFRAVDGQGRSWERTHLFSMRDFGDEASDGAYGCTTGEGETIAPGQEQSIILSFLVPSDVVEDLRYEVTVDTSDDPERPRPDALVFEAEELEE